MSLIEVQKIAEFARRALPLKDAALSEEYFYQSLPLCLIDAVYSIGVRYKQVQNVVDRYCIYCDLKKLRDNRQLLPLPNTQESITDFLKKVHDVGSEAFASDIFQNRQRTSSTNGILKAEAIDKFGEVLKKYGVDYLNDIPKIIQNIEFEEEIKKIPGQKSGISLQYFFMLAGSEDLIKPDRMINRFIKGVLQRPLRINEAQQLLGAVSLELKPSYPNMTARLLDNLIWQYQRQLVQQSQAGRASC